MPRLVLPRQPTRCLLFLVKCCFGKEHPAQSRQGGPSLGLLLPAPQNVAPSRGRESTGRQIWVISAAPPGTVTPPPLHSLPSFAFCASSASPTFLPLFSTFNTHFHCF